MGLVTSFGRWTRRLWLYFTIGNQIIPKYDRLVLVISGVMGVSTAVMTNPAQGVVVGLAIECVSAIPIMVVGWWDNKRAEKNKSIIQYDTHIRNRLNPELMAIHENVKKK